MITPIGANVRRVTLLLALAFLVTSIGVGYWSLVAADDLSSDPYNPRLLATLHDRPRGRIVAADGTVLASSVKTPDGYRRHYTDPSLAQVVGYASFKYGATGIEGAYAEALVGRDPADPIGQWRQRYLQQQPEPGSVQLGILPAVQRAAAAALAGRRGAVIALDPRTGAVIASVSFPGYDPNLIVDPGQQDVAWQQVNAATDHPLIDRAREGLYPPGSTFKLVTASAGLESGWDPRAQVRVDDPFRADPSWGSYAVRSPSQAHGNFDMSLAFQRSENIYFAKLALQIGGPRLAEYASRFGVGAAPRADLATAKGQISSNAQLDRPILVADTAYGQGELLVSPLQMALIAATIARGGSLPIPHYATAVLDASGQPLRLVDPGSAGQVVRPDTAATVAADMVAAVEAPGAYAYGAKIPGVHVAGKTGTAENPSGAPHGWFVGFAPAESPTVVVAVVIENSANGGLDAAPVGAAVMRAALGK
ncbi:MAG: penicillin-binding protein 2 [Chloroflexota bacterium]|nr:penicillin-binding protein 2 [Chloroflexota bacterium]MDE3194092.1 penicillin-binding protein 2 [Chloroflexota bacterium]